jgi:hypothetical protein
MFVRTLCALVGTTVVAVTLAVAAAMATDEPAPPVPAPKPPTQGAPQQPSSPRACRDNTRPLSRLEVRWQRGFRRGVIRGIAIDQGCGANGAGKLKSVSVAVSRQVGGNRCQHLQRNGRLGHAGACTHVWLKAKGTRKWSFRLRRNLPRGKYLVATRAIDAAGNVETETRSHR